MSLSASFARAGPCHGVSMGQRLAAEGLASLRCGFFARLNDAESVFGLRLNRLARSVADNVFNEAEVVASSAPCLAATTCAEAMFGRVDMCCG